MDKKYIHKNSFSDRIRKGLWKQYSFSKGLINSRKNPLLVDPLSLIQNYLYAQLYVKYLLEPKQFEGLQEVITVLKDKGIQKIRIFYHPDTTKVPSRDYYDKRVETKKRYTDDEYKAKIMNCEERIAKMESLQIDGVKCYPKSYSEFHKREISLYASIDQHQVDPCMSILCDRDFSDLGSVETTGIKGVTYTYIKFRKSGDSQEVKEMETNGWKPAQYKEVQPNQGSYPVTKVLSGNYPDIIENIGDTMRIQVVHFREKSHVDVLRSILQIQKPNFNEIQNIIIRTIKRKKIFLWDKQDLTMEEETKLGQLEEQDEKCINEFVNDIHNIGKNIEMDDNASRHDFHVNFIDIPNATSKDNSPYPVRILCDEGFQYHVKKDSNLPEMAKKTRPFLLVTLFDYKNEIKYCFKHSYIVEPSFENLDLSSTSYTNLLACDGLKINCPQCGLLEAITNNSTITE